MTPTFLIVRSLSTKRRSQVVFIVFVIVHVVVHVVEPEQDLYSIAMHYGVRVVDIKTAASRMLA